MIVPFRDEIDDFANYMRLTLNNDIQLQDLRCKELWQPAKNLDSFDVSRDKLTLECTCDLPSGRGSVWSRLYM